MGIRVSLLAAIVSTWTGAAFAGTAVQPATCDEGCYRALYAFMPVYMEKHAPVLAAPAERFEAAAKGDAKVCPARKGPSPSVFGVMLGPTAIEGFTKLQGPPNDIQLMTQVMADRGITQDFISVSQGDAADRAGMLTAMSRPLPCLRENDQVVLIYTGWGTVYPQEWFDNAGFLREFCAAPAAEETHDICGRLHEPGENAEFISSLTAGISWAYGQWLYMSQPTTAFAPGNRLHVLMGSGSKVNERGIDYLTGVSAADISNFVTRIRNRGADAFLIIDTRLAASGELYALQTQAAAEPAWAASGSAMMQYNGFPPLQDQEHEREPVALFGTGEYAVLYASDVNSEAFEYAQGEDRRPLGALIFRVAEALRQDSSIKFRDMALVIAKSFDAVNRERSEEQKQDPLFQASNPDLTFLAPRLQPAQKKTDGGIEIISPSPKRGAASVEEEALSVVARYTGGAKAQMAIIDGDLVPVDANGQFRGDVSDAGSKFTVALRVLGANYETLATAELRLRDKPAEPVIASPARRIALVIANQNYTDPAFQPLRTPFADAEAVAEVLGRRFGFVTRLETGEAPLELFLKDATKAQIEQVLFQLRRRLTAEDQLLIYYAGHGENDPDLGAFWVPADGEAGADFTWVEAHEITTALKRMNAASVLVISDSCYAGGLSRGGGETASRSEARDRYLAKASRMKSRQLMASGGEEPVEDGGGGGHSVFAKALIEALRSMPEETFTASELFEQKVKPAVISAANALTEGQTPGFSRIVRAGDEPGSEFVFQAAATVP